MAKQTMKALRETAEAMLEAGISNKQQLLAAVPAVVALQDATRRLGYTLNADGGHRGRRRKRPSSVRSRLRYGAIVVIPGGAATTPLRVAARDPLG